MAYSPTTWVDGTTAITATELNRIETGVDDAHTALAKIFVGSVGSTGLADFLPSGWSSLRTGAGTYRIDFDVDFGDDDYVVVANTTFAPAYFAACTLHGSTGFFVTTFDASGTESDVPFRFILIRS